MTEQALVAAGFSARQILLYGLALLAMVSLGAAFILVALSGWRRESLSAMVVESGLIATVGGITARYREKSDAEKTDDAPTGSSPDGDGSSSQGLGTATLARQPSVVSDG